MNRDFTEIEGHKGGDKQRAAVEAPDSLRSIATAKILDLLSEGEIEGFVTEVATGVQADALKDIFLDETPIANADGTLNFKNVQIDTRVGTQTQDYIMGFPSVENEIAINIVLTFAASFVRAVSNMALSAVRVRLSVNALSKADATTGDINGHQIDYAIDVATDGGAYVERLTSAFVGKTSSGYERSHRIDLPPATVSGWNIRVRRLTTDQASAYIQDVTNVVSMTEIVDGKFRYPNSALCGIQIDASQFQSIPKRTYHIKGRRIKVPANYNPITRAYATTGIGTSGGAWDGTFQTAWTDNPAWIFFDMATHPRYGLGHLVPESLVDKWSLYGIAQYCDGLVSDGMGGGGMEPRFTCNLFLQSQADAYKVLQDLASVFRGICYWSNGSIVPVSDRPTDPVYTYTNANVEEGLFRYEGSGRRARHTVALVSWSDPADFGRAKIEYVEDADGIARYGVQQTEVIGIGTTRRSEARRIGREILVSERLETDTCSWTVGLDGTYAVPGQIVRVADRFRAGRRMGGRIASATAASIIVDSWPEVMPVAGDVIIVILPTGVSQDRVILSVTVGTKTIVPTVAFSSVPLGTSVWATESATLKTQNYRVLSVAEAVEGKGFTIIGLRHNSSKYANIDTGAAIEIPPTSVIPSSVQLPPTTVTITSAQRAGQVVAMSILTAAWPAAQGAVKYLIQWRKDNGNWSPDVEVHGTVAEYINPFAGVFSARVYSVNALGIISIAKQSVDFTLVDQTKEPGVVVAINATLGSIASDNVLSAGEKPTVIQERDRIVAEQTGIGAKATALAITTEKTNYDSAITALGTYLATLTTPVLWSNLTGNTTIVGTTFRQVFLDVYAARQTLLNRIAVQTLDQLPDGPTYGRLRNTALTAGDVDLAKAGVVGRTADNIAEGAARKWAAESGAQVVTGKSLDILVDGATYGRTRNTALTAGDVDLAKAGVVGRTADNIAEAATRKWAAESGANITETRTAADFTGRGFLARRNSVDLAVGTEILNRNADNIAEGGTRKWAAESGADVTINRIGAAGDIYVLNADMDAGDIHWIKEGGWRWEVEGTAGRYTRDGSAGAPDGALINAKRIKVTEGQTLKAVGYLRSFAVTNGEASIAIYYFNSAGAFQGIPRGNFVTANGITQRSVLNQRIPANVDSVSVSFYCTNHTTGHWLTDNARLSMTVDTIDEVPDSPTFGRTSQTDLVSNRIGLRVAGSGHRPGNLFNLQATIVGSISSRWDGLTLGATEPGTTAPATVTFTASAATLRGGSASASYSATSATASQARNTTVTYQMYYLDDAYTGGTRTLNITTAGVNLSNADGILYLGQMTMTVPALGTSGGGTPEPFCVATFMRMPDGSLAGEVVADQQIACWDEIEPAGVEMLAVESSRHVPSVQCLKLTTESGAWVVASACTPMTLRDLSVVLLPDMLGLGVLVAHHRWLARLLLRVGAKRVFNVMLGCRFLMPLVIRLAWEQVTQLEAAGLWVVAKIKVRQRCYFAGATADATIATHNPTAKP